MKRDRHPSERLGDEDSWEALAANLFGIEFGSGPRVDDLSADDLLDEDLDEPPPSEPEPVAEPAAKAADDEDVEEDETQPVAEKPQDRSEADTYWDALKDWDWSEGGETSRPVRAATRTSRGRRPERRREEPPAPAAPAPPPERRPERREVAPASRAAGPGSDFVEDSDFGAGLVEHRPSAASTAPSRGAPSVRPETRRPVEDEEGESVERRRRRRRRRRGPEDDVEPLSPAGRALIEDDEDEPAFDEPTFSQEAPAAEPGRGATDEFEPRRRRRRRRRRGEAAEESALEGRSSELAEDESDAYNEPSVWDPEAEEPEDDELIVEPVYRDVPSWEEAISYLVNPRTSEPRGTSPERERDPDRGPRRRRRRR